MNFGILLKRISPGLKRLARRLTRGHNIHGFFDEEDLYQEMCIHLWNNFKNGVPDNLNDAYIIKGCEFYIRNYLRKKREKAYVISLEKPLNENGDTLKNILTDKREPLDRLVDKKMTIADIRSNGCNEREEKVFSLLLTGYTVREVGERLGISHVMVVKHKKKTLKKWQRKENSGYRNKQIFTFNG